MSKIVTLKIQRMNYCIFDVKRQRGENTVHPDAEQKHQTRSYRTRHLKIQNNSIIPSPTETVTFKLRIIASNPLLQKQSLSNSAYGLLYFRRQAAAWRKYSNPDAEQRYNTPFHNTKKDPPYQANPPRQKNTNTSSEILF